MQRSPTSHKGENGKVAVIGGSRFMHGAPIFSALAAEASGVDLIYLVLPDWHENVAKGMSLNFQVYPFLAEEELSKADIEPILELLATMDCAVLGPGIDHSDEKSKKALIEIIEGASCSLVLDATALQPETLKAAKGKSAVLTPHLGELERMEIAPKDLQKSAEESGIVILLKDQVDKIAGPNEKYEEVEGGNAGLTVGGTGDALAGLIAGLIAQKMDPFEAAIMGSKIIKGAADRLEKKNGFAFTTADVIGEIPNLIKDMS
ncbi:NAD(P)H-hydrate dehydratase [Patescibacteria group bacterium]|nr:NAD(P)H-hydrate dehydratase [Patescibacteria group bacterium]